jgi:hypothetical protein
VAVLGRSCPNVALPLLDHLIAQREQSLRQFTTSGADCSACWEEVCVLLRLSAHVLADDGDGETPLIPEAIIQMSHQAAQTGAQDLAEQLSWRVGDVLLGRSRVYSQWVTFYWADVGYILSG